MQCFQWVQKIKKDETGRFRSFQIVLGRFKWGGKWVEKCRAQKPKQYIKLNSDTEVYDREATLV